MSRGKSHQPIHATIFFQKTAPLESLVLAVCFALSMRRRYPMLFFFYNMFVLFALIAQIASNVDLMDAGLGKGL